jgi:hypothetical protein
MTPIEPITTDEGLSTRKVQNLYGAKPKRVRGIILAVTLLTERTHTPRNIG